MAAEIRTFVRTLGPAIFADHYRKLRAPLRQLGLSETEEALEFARQYFMPNAIMQYSELVSFSKLGIEELSRCAKSAVVCSQRKHCFSEAMCEPSNFSQFGNIWRSKHQTGIGKRLAVAFIQHFGLKLEALNKRAKQSASHFLFDALPQTEPVAEHATSEEGEVSCEEVGSPLTCGTPETLLVNEDHTDCVWQQSLVGHHEPDFALGAYDHDLAGVCGSWETWSSLACFSASDGESPLVGVPLSSSLSMCKPDPLFNSISSCVTADMALSNWTAIKGLNVEDAWKTGSSFFQSTLAC